MDKDLVESARKLFAENLYESICKFHSEENHDYCQKHIDIAQEYFTPKMKKELRKMGFKLR